MDKKFKILVVEDNEAFRTVLCSELKRSGYDILYEVDGEAGFNTAEKIIPDIILLDIMLPKINGIQFLGRLRATGWGKEMKVLLLTETHDIKTVADAIDFGISGYLVKSDYTIPDIIQKVGVILQK